MREALSCVETRLSFIGDELRPVGDGALGWTGSSHGPRPRDADILWTSLVFPVSTISRCPTAGA